MCLFQFNLASRPGETLSFRRGWLLRIRPKENVTAVPSFPGEQAATDKSNQRGNTAVIGKVSDQVWLVDLVRKLNLHFESNGLFNLRVTKYESEFGENVKTYSA